MQRILLAVATTAMLAVSAPTVSNGQIAPIPRPTPSADSARTRTAGFTGFTISGSFTMGANHSVEMSYPVIRDVRADSPAAGAGLVSGDVILEVKGVDARKEGALFPTVGERYVMRIRRGDAEREVVLTPVPKPSKTGARP